MSVQSPFYKTFISWNHFKFNRNARFNILASRLHHNIYCTFTYTRINAGLIWPNLPNERGVIEEFIWNIKRNSNTFFSITDSELWRIEAKYVMSVLSLKKQKLVYFGKPYTWNKLLFSKCRRHAIGQHYYHKDI